MTEKELATVKEQKAALEVIAREYPGRTIENIIQNLDARIRNYEQTKSRQP